MPSAPVARVYVDGFNLYKGALADSPSKWLDLGKWADRMMPSFVVDKVAYCTARLAPDPDDPTLHIRQDIYLQALSTLSRVQIYEGHFKVNNTRMRRRPEDGCTCCAAQPPACKCCKGKTVPVIKREEKGSDVRLAIELLDDGINGRYDVALVVSGDSDIQPAVDLVRHVYGKRVFVADPRNRTHPPLVGDERRRVRAAALAASQLPATITGPSGSPITKPASW